METKLSAKDQVQAINPKIRLFVEKRAGESAQRLIVLDEHDESLAWVWGKEGVDCYENQVWQEALEYLNSRPFLEGIPHFIYHQGLLRTFEVKRRDGEVVRAYLDPTNQYSAEGPTWRQEGNRKALYDVAGFRCIDGIPAR
jgi:hypothetical protein